MTGASPPELSCEDRKIVKKMLYLYELELGSRMGFCPGEQGDHFIAAMTAAFNHAKEAFAKVKGGTHA